MRRSARRMRVDEVGQLEIVDPGLDDLAVLRAVDPHFAISSASLPSFGKPRMMALRSFRTAIPAEASSVLPLEEMWKAHNQAVRHWRSGKPTSDRTGISLLALKAAIAWRLLSACVLCARRCGVDRAAGEAGKCRLGAEAYVAEHFVHIAEESPINPSLVLNMRGCALRCRFCQQYALLNVKASQTERLTPTLWNDLDTDGARSISFVGGNPDESLPAILSFLNAIPQHCDLPIVWNNHAYMSREVVRLLDGVIDCYVPDFKYYNNECGRSLSGVLHYPKVAKASIGALLEQNVPVIVRILVLPGHNECCHLPTMKWLAKQKQRNNLFISIRGQYSPDWKISKRDGTLARRAKRGEIEMVIAAATDLGLSLVH